ncbi:MAG: MotA/TolQ/ExbB proton channel family protein [Elusimicrobia bacterium]|jgi:biopolymer transport protein ExbB|nr:MotA/TolQ/ExbB proton channel family protein [Elusimicrobiota bacterium]
MENINYLAIFKDSFTLAILLFCSLLSMTFAFERWFFFRKAKQKRIDEFLAHVSGLLKKGEVEKAADYAAKIDSPVSRLFHYALQHREMSRHDLEELLATKRQEERLGMERNLGVLGTMGNIAPFIGLFGTVVGIIKAFRDLALSGAGGPAVVAKGIAEALVATAGGLAVAIPAVIIYNYFMRKTKVISSELEIFSARLVIMLETK